MSIVKWATELAESLGKPEAAKFIYDWAKTSGGKIPNAAETERLSRAVGEGFNAVGYRYSANPAKDEQHLQKMLLDPKRLADENRAFHVDITPGAPAARTRAFNVTGDPGVFEPGYADVRPLALRLENVVRGSDEQANATRFLTEALKRNSTGVRYTPVEGELSGPARNVDSPFYTLAKGSGSNYQPSVAMIDPTAVRDLRTAAFTPRTKAALAAAVAAGATPLLQAKEAFMPLDPLDKFSPPRYRSAGRRPEANNDRTAAANAPLSALRGWLAGTAGLPGDIEGLARAGISQLPPQLLTAFPALRAFGIGSRADPTPQLPTTEFYNEYLPGAQLNETPTGKAFTTAGNLFGGAGSTTLARYGIKSAKATAKAIAEAAPGPASGSRAAQLGVIKMPGGNWLKHSVEDAVKPMKSQPPAISGEIIDDIAGTQLFDDYRKFYDAGNETVGLRQWVEKNHPDVYKQLVGEQGTVLNNFIDKKIAPYIRNEMATPDDPLRAMAEKYAVDKPVKLAEVQARIDDFAAKMEQTARDRGVPVEQLTSMRQQMIGLEKEKALVEAREGLHVDLQQLNFRPEAHGKYLQPGQTAVAQSLPAKAWEGASDLKIISMPASERLNTTISLSQKNLDENPWLAKVPPETTVHTVAEPRRLSSDLGFDHLVDELRNAINPASGLPANLLIDPADLGKFTMPQAVDRVADINAWRATQRIEANQAIANNAATQVVKEYPEQGVKWVELSNSGHSMDKLPEGWSLQEFEGSSPGSKIFGVVDSKGHLHPEAAGKHPETPKIAYENFKKGFGVKELEAALKYEGDTMQHCVGGYCPDVVEGRSRIYSLRDTKGQPRVTIEVKPHEGWFTKADGMPDPSGKNKSFHELIDNERSELARQKGGFGYIGESYEDIANRLADQYGLKTDPTIAQIKGFRNKKPADEYLPMVQDFVKSGNWSDVKDLRNTGLRRTLDAFNSNELKMIQDAGIEVPTWASGEDLQRLHNSITPEGQRLKYDSRGQVVGREDEYLDPTQYAHGGFVSNHFDPIKIKQIIAGLDDEYDPENIQQIIAQRESAYA